MAAFNAAPSAENANSIKNSSDLPLNTPEKPDKKTHKTPLFSKKFLFLPGILIIAAFVGLYFYQQKEPAVPRPAFNQNYRLVPEKISQSANIKINLPPKLNFADVQSRIKLAHTEFNQ